MEYAPGKTIVAADALSRAYLANDEPEISEEEMKCHVHMVLQHIPMSEQKMAQYVQETKTDEGLLKVIGYHIFT